MKHMGRNASNRGDPSAEFLRPEDRSAAKAAADIEDLAAQGLRRFPNLGRVAEHPLLSVDQRAAQLGNRRMFRRRVINEAGVVMDAGPGP